MYIVLDDVGFPTRLVAVDASGEPYGEPHMDLEQKAAMMLARE